jgi:hypothetical protein
MDTITSMRRTRRRKQNIDRWNHCIHTPRHTVEVGKQRKQQQQQHNQQQQRQGIEKRVALKNVRRLQGGNPFVI